MRYRTTSLFILGLSIGMAWLCQCAYYNTLFNAKRLFDRAENIRRESTTDQIPPAASEFYAQAIKKTAKVLKFYPQHACVDEALLVMGKAFYYQGEYEKALRKFKELTVQYPRSRFLAEGFLWMGIIYSRLENYAKAEEVFTKLLKTGDVAGAREVRDNALFMLAEVTKRSTRNYTQAIATYREMLAAYPRSEIRQETQFNIAECFYSQGDYAQAEREFALVRKYRGPRAMAYRAVFRMGQCLLEQQKPQEALDLYRTLLRDEKNEKFFPEIKLAVAACHERLRDFPSAIKVYEEIVAAKAPSASTPQAYYRLGLLYKDKLENFTQAEECFGKAVETSKDSTTDSLKIVADHEQKNVQEFNFYTREVFKQAQDSTSVASRFRLAELYLLNFDQADSALAQYQAVVEKHPGDPAVPKALAASGWVYEYKKNDPETARKNYLAVIEQYPASPYAESLRVRLGLVSATKTREVQALEQFQTVEQQRLDQGVSLEVVQGYRQVADTYTGTLTAAKAGYVVAWLYDYALDDSAQARQAYQQVVTLYPESDYGKKALLKLNPPADETADTTAPKPIDIKKVREELDRKDQQYREMMPHGPGPRGQRLPSEPPAPGEPEMESEMPIPVESEPIE
jgi:TolA-binding protein